ncbi:MAG: hypothetical protein ACRD19_15720, partial [Terriglobia bacterium]
REELGEFQRFCRGFQRLAYCHVFLLGGCEDQPGISFEVRVIPLALRPMPEEVLCSLRSQNETVLHCSAKSSKA